MARIASIWLIALAITVNSAASKGHYHDKNYFGRFEDLDRPGKTGKIILSFHSKAVSGVRYFKGRAVILRGSIVENLGLDTYGWLSGDKALLFTDKKFVWDNISPPNRFEVLNFYGFGSSGLATHYPAVFCNYRFELFFRVQNGSLSKRTDVVVTGNSFIVDKCPENFSNLSISGSILGFEDFSRQANEYIVLTILVNFAQIYLLFRQIGYSNTTARTSKLSFYTFMFFGVNDSFIIMVHVFVGVTYQSMFSAFTFIVMTEFLIFSVFDMKFAIMLVTADIENEQVNEIDEMRSRLGKLYLKFCAILVVSTFIMYSEKIAFFSFFFCSFWVPQIIHNAFYGVNRVFRKEFIVGISFCKIFFFSYYYGSKQYNLFNSHAFHGHAVLILLFLYLMAQMAILLMMDRFGPRFFVPIKWRPKKYSYFRPLPKEDVEANGRRSCVICISPIKKPESDGIMVTPCDHFFHSECLKTWMEQQLKCPICRTQLPSTED